MFEAVLLTCVIGSTETCREILKPGYEAETEAECALAAEASQNDDIRCQPIGDALAVRELAPGVFAHLGIISDANEDNQGDVANLGFIIGDTSVLVVDTGGSRLVGERLWRAIRAVTDKPVSHVVLTHMHPDHVLGTSVFMDVGARIVGHGGLARALADRAGSYLDSFGGLIGEKAFLGTTITSPDVGIKVSDSIDLGNRKITLTPWPTAHTGNDLTVLDETSAIMFTGDLLFEDHAPALDGSVKGWRQVLREMEEMGASRVVPGHGGPLLDWPEASEPLSAYLAILEAETRAAIDEGLSLGQAAETVAQSERENWSLFDLFNPRNATVAYTELEWE